MTTASTSDTPRPVRSRVVPVLLLVLALGQVASPIVSSALGGGRFTTADRAGEPPIVPAGYAFSIWGLVELLSVSYAAWALFTRSPGNAVRRDLAYPLLVVFAGFSAWIAVADLEPVWSTLAVFLVMVAGLLVALRTALRHRAEIATWPSAGRLLLWSLLGVYTGWSSIAIWINLSTAAAGSGAPLSGLPGTLGQLAVLAGATASAVALLRWTGGLLSCSAAVVWAFAGVIAGTTGAGATPLAIAAAAGLVIVVVATLQARHRTVPDAVPA